MTLRPQPVHVLAMALALCAGIASAQSTGVPQQSTPPEFGQRTHSPLGANDQDNAIDSGVKANMEAARQKSIATDRRKHMVADAEKLVQLANEIKAEVDKTPKDELSVTVIKKTAEMEKLARDIRTRMAN